jgi:hypothetical protein
MAKNQTPPPAKALTFETVDEALVYIGKMKQEQEQFVAELKAQLEKTTLETSTEITRLTGERDNATANVAELKAQLEEIREGMEAGVKAKPLNIQLMDVSVELFIEDLKRKWREDNRELEDSKMPVFTVKVAPKRVAFYRVGTGNTWYLINAVIPAGTREHDIMQEYPAASQAVITTVYLPD